MQRRRMPNQRTIRRMAKMRQTKALQMETALKTSVMHQMMRECSQSGSGRQQHQP